MPTKAIKHWKVHRKQRLNHHTSTHDTWTQNPSRWWWVGRMTSLVVVENDVIESCMKPTKKHDQEAWVEGDATMA